MATVHLTWDDNNSGISQEDGFRIYRSLTPIDPDALPAVFADLSADSTSFDDDTAPIGAVYYAVSAYRAGVERVSIFEEIVLIGSVAIHQYWRILFTEQHGDISNRVSMSEIEFHDMIGGADLTIPAEAVAKASSKSNFPGNPPNMAFDDTHSSGTWFTTDGSVLAGGGEWIMWDFGIGNEKAIVEVVYRAIHTQLGLCAKAFTVQHSDDDITWTDAWSEAAIPAWSANELRLFSA